MPEDDAALGSGIQLALQSPEVQITLCTALSQARAELARNRFDLLILDVNLPDGSGLQLLAEVRKTSPVPVIRMVFLFNVYFCAPFISCSSYSDD